MTGRGRRGGGRLTERVRTARRRSSSSTRWLQRQLNDPYVREAKGRGYRSRAAFKLIELDDRFHFLAPAKRVLDLGAAPGGWTQVAVERVRPGNGRQQAGDEPTTRGGRVVAVDRDVMAAVPGATVLTLDVTAPEALAQIRGTLGGKGQADVVLSDMAPAATGHSATDHLRIVALVEAAFDIAEKLLAPGGVFVAKVFQGGAEGELLDRLKRRFANVRHAKPPASRAESAETYVVATGFRDRRPEVAEMPPEEAD